MTVYAIRRSTEPEYKELELSLLDVVSASPEEIELDDILKFYEVNLSMKKWWIPLACNFFEEPNGRIQLTPDICVWTGATLLLSKRAYNLLQDSIEPFGEFLPIALLNEQYYIFNCLTYGVDDLEASESDYQQGQRTWVTKLSVEPQNKEQLLFKSAYERGHTLFCNQRFVDIVEQLGLKGLGFDTELVQKMYI